jgi:hypothetical protein
MFLQTPSSYLTLAQLKSDPTLTLTDLTGMAIPDDVLNDFLEEHSGEIDALIGQSFLPQEATLSLRGNGTNRLTIPRDPLIYVKQVKVVLPTTTVGFEIPLSSLLIDYENATLLNQSPLVFQGGATGLTTAFARNVPIFVTCAWGVNFPVPAPTFTAAPATSSGTPLSAGNHTVQVSSSTWQGESLPSSTQTVTLSSPGGILVTILNNPGAQRFFVYVDGVFAAEILSFTSGSGSVKVTVDATVPSSPIALDATGSRKVPVTVDSTFVPLKGRYAALRMAQKLLIQQRLWELKNKSNQGIYQTRSGQKLISYKDAMHNANIFANKLDAVLSSLKYQGMANG